MPHTAKYAEMYDYLSAPALPTSPEDTVVFGRKDPLVAQTLGNLIIPGLVETAVITGGIGKDSGDILALGFRSEAHYLMGELERDARERSYLLPTVTLEEKAKHGGENASFSLDILQKQGGDTSSLTAVAHGTSALRLAETLKIKAFERTGIMPTIYRAPSAYSFEPTNPDDQAEAVGELRRLIDWPEQGLLLPRTDIPENLIDFIADKHGNVPLPPSRLASYLVGRLQAKLQVKLLQAAARRSNR